jgi:hypothetical protein
MSGILVHWSSEDAEESVPSTPRDLVTLGVYEAQGPILHIGRGNQNDIHLSHKAVSRNHIRLSEETDIWYVSDLGSTNGTTLNGESIADKTLLCSEDVVVLAGVHALMFQDPDLNLRELKETYQGMCKHEFPLDLSDHAMVSLHLLGGGGKLFVSPEVIESSKYYFIQGDIDEFLDSAPDGYKVTGWWGHGVNSYAFYYMRITEHEKIFFRLPYGGIYMDNDKAAEKISDFLEEYAKFRELASSLECSYSLTCSMNPVLEYRVHTSGNSADGGLPYSAVSFGILGNIIETLADLDE